MHLKQGLDLQVPQQAGTACTLSELCKGGITVLKVMRRFGCPLTRKEAREISRYSEELDKMGVRLVGVGFDTAGASGFGLGGFWNGELFLDEKRGVYDFFGLKRLGKFSSLLTLLQKETRNLISSAKDTCRGNASGDRFQLGGTFVIDKAGKVIFSHIQKDFADFSPMDDIIDVCQHEILRCSRIDFRASSLKAKKKSLLPYKGPHFKKQTSFPASVMKPEFKKQSFSSTNKACFEAVPGSLRYTTDNSTTNSTCSLETTLEEPDASYTFNLIHNEKPQEYNYFSNSHLFQSFRQ